MTKHIFIALSKLLQQLNYFFCFLQLMFRTRQVVPTEHFLLEIFSHEMFYHENSLIYNANIWSFFADLLRSNITKFSTWHFKTLPSSRPHLICDIICTVDYSATIVFKISLNSFRSWATIVAHTQSLHSLKGHLVVTMELVINVYLYYLSMSFYF